MKHFKKWHIVTLIILGIGGSWLTQNMWVFGKRITVVEYENYLEDTQWIMDDGSKWFFNSNNELLIIVGDTPELNRKYFWEVRADFLGYSENSDLDPLIFSSRIRYLTKSKMQIWANSSILRKINFTRNEN